MRPGTNVALLTAMAHVIVTEGPGRRRSFVAERCEAPSFDMWREFVARAENSPEAMREVTGVPPSWCAAPRALYATGGNGSIYYGLGVTEHSQGSTTVMAIANLAMATGNIGRRRGVNRCAARTTMRGSCDMGSFRTGCPAIATSPTTPCAASSERDWGVTLQPEPGLRIPNMFEAALGGSFLGLYCQGEDIVESDPTAARGGGAVGDGMHRGAGPVPEQNHQVRARLPAGLVVPGEGRHVHQLPNGASRRVRKVMRPLQRHGRLGNHHGAVQRPGLPMHYAHPSGSWTRSRA